MVETKRICHSVKSNLVVITSGPLWDTHIVVQISKSLKVDEFSDDRRYSILAWPITYMSYLMVPAYSIMRSNTSLIVKEETMVCNLDTAIGEYRAK
jgi:hypothetical protein